MKKKIVSVFMIGLLAMAQMVPTHASEVSEVAGEIEVSSGASSSSSTTASQQNPVTGNYFSESNSGANILESSNLIQSIVTTSDIG